MTVIDTIFKALAPAMPDRVIAGHHADLVVTTLHGINQEGRFFITSIGPVGGGWGAKSSEDGIGVTVCINDGDTHNGPTEQMEAKYPILVEKYGLRTDSGGAGQHRGGLGAEMVVTALSPFSFNTYTDRQHCPPWGLEGGLPALGNALEMRIDGEWRSGPNAKAFSQRLKAGDAYRVLSGGGGGFGDPRLRPADKVAHDVSEGYVSRDAARTLYGVALNDDGSIDEAATQGLRAGAGK